MLKRSLLLLSTFPLAGLSLTAWSQDYIDDLRRNVPWSVVRPTPGLRLSPQAQAGRRNARRESASRDARRYRYYGGYVWDHHQPYGDPYGYTPYRGYDDHTPYGGYFGSGLYGGYYPYTLYPWAYGYGSHGSYYNHGPGPGWRYHSGRSHSSSGHHGHPGLHGGGHHSRGGGHHGGH